MKKLTQSLEHTGVPYVFSAQGEKPHPTVTVLGGVHGNEKAGITAVKKLISYTHHHTIKTGTLHAAIANIAAMKQDKRFIDQDLNRSFGESKAPNSYEKQRVHQLKPLLASTDILFDIHSTLKPSEPFIAIPNIHKFLGGQNYGELIRKFGISTIITGEGLWPKGGEPIYADTFVEANGGFGITIEAGWIQDSKTAQIIHGVKAALHYLGIFEGQYPHAPTEKEFEIWHAKENIVAEPGFTFKKGDKVYEWKNFEEVPKGTIYATANDITYIAPEDLWMVFPKPNSNIVTGNEVCILAKKLIKKEPC